MRDDYFPIARDSLALHNAAAVAASRKIKAKAAFCARGETANKTPRTGGAAGAMVRARWMGMGMDGWMEGRVQRAARLIPQFCGGAPCRSGVLPVLRTSYPS